MSRRLIAYGVASLTWLYSTGAASAGIVAGQIDTFQNGTPANWTNGHQTGPQVVATGGPAGAGDRYIRVDANGLGGAGSRMVIFNRSQWTGNFTAAHVSAVDMDLKNLSTVALPMRIVIANDSSEAGWTTTNAFSLPADGNWHHAEFQLSSSAMTPLPGAPTLATTLASVGQFRILSTSSPKWEGDSITASIGIDNIAAVAVPEPICSGAVILAAGLLARRRDVPFQPPAI